MFPETDILTEQALISKRITFVCSEELANKSKQLNTTMERCVTYLLSITPKLRGEDK
jgi:hypothetical protein